MWKSLVFINFITGKFHVRMKSTSHALQGEVCTRAGGGGGDGQGSLCNPGDPPAFATVSGFPGPRMYVPRREDTQRQQTGRSEQ